MVLVNRWGGGVRRVFTRVSRGRSSKGWFGTSNLMTGSSKGDVEGDVIGSTLCGGEVWDECLVVKGVLQTCKSVPLPLQLLCVCICWGNSPTYVLCIVNKLTIKGQKMPLTNFCGFLVVLGLVHGAGCLLVTHLSNDKSDFGMLQVR